MPEVPGSGDFLTGDDAWRPRLCETTGVAHLAAAVRWGNSGEAGMRLFGYQTKCRGSFLVHDQYVIETISKTSPIVDRVTCIECIARDA